MLADLNIWSNCCFQPEGIQQCYSVSNLININNLSDNSSTQSENFAIQIPPDTVSGSEKVKLQVYGEINFHLLIYFFHIKTVILNKQLFKL